MTESIDIVVPSCKPRQAIDGLIAEIASTAGVSHRIVPTCLDESAAINRNVGLEQCCSPIVAMVDDDVEAFPIGWLGELAEVLRTVPDCVMVSAKLLRHDGSPGIMAGFRRPPRDTQGLVESSRRELPTACVVIRNDGMRFDEGYLGSGWEDSEFCLQLRERYPRAKFLVHCGVPVVHRNEMKQQAENWQHNKARYYARRQGATHP